MIDYPLMLRVVLTSILALIILAIPANSQAPASTDGEPEATLEQVLQEASAPVSLATQEGELDLILPLAGPSIHTDYIGEANTYVWRDINSGQYHAYGVENGKFTYQPGDTWFVYGIFGPIEAVKYDWNVKYTNWGGRHNGIDFATTISTPIISASGGEVVFIGERAGHTIVVKTENFQITYSHLDSFAVKVGERISQGQLIGYTGSSGTPNPHLHFEIAIMPDVPTNRYVDGPLDWNNLVTDFSW